MSRTECVSYLRCAARAAAPELGLTRLQLSVRQLGCCFPLLARRRLIAAFAFEADGWKRRKTGEWENITEYQKIDTKGLRKL